MPTVVIMPMNRAAPSRQSPSLKMSSAASVHAIAPAITPPTIPPRIGHHHRFVMARG